MASWSAVSLLLDLLGPRHTFEGGLFLTDYKSATAKRPIETLAVHATLHVPLSPHPALPTQPLVEVGQRVHQGERLSSPLTEAGVAVHAPVSGEVAGLERVWTPLDGYVAAVVLRPDMEQLQSPSHPPRFPGAESSSTPAPPTQTRLTTRPHSASPSHPDTPSHGCATWHEDSITAALADHGVFCPSHRVGLQTALQRAAAAGVTEFIVNAMETEPYLVSDLRTLVEEPGRLIDATAEIADALGAMQVYFALPYRHRRVVKRIEAEARGRFIEVAALSHKYPQCDPVVLVKTLLDREVPPGGGPLDVGVFVLPLAAIRMTAQAILDGRPVTHTVVTVAGDAVERPGAYRVAIGTLIRDLAARVGLLVPPEEVVWGGPLTGIQLDHSDAVVTIDTRGVLMFRSAQAVEPVPCIRCGWCVEDCPVGLDPSMLIHLEAQASCTTIEATELQACVDCGLCSHICPSQLPLAQSIHRARNRFGRLRT